MVMPPAAGACRIVWNTNVRNVSAANGRRREKRREPVPGSAVQRAGSTLQASLGDRICPQDQDHRMIFASSSLCQTGGRGHWPGQMSVN